MSNKKDKSQSSVVVLSSQELATEVKALNPARIELYKIQKREKELLAQIEENDRKILAFLQANDCESFDSDTFTFIKIDEIVRRVVDIKKLKEAHLYDTFTKESITQARIKTEIKNILDKEIEEEGTLNQVS